MADSTSPLFDPSNWQPPSPEQLQALLPGYRIECFLARGGMGAVYRGMQLSLERLVAIKILPPQLLAADPNFAERFKQEAKAMAQFNHPGIVSVYDFGEMQDGTLYFVMEYVDGTDVARMIQRQGRLRSAHAMAIAAHVCDALQYAHERGVVHRDIKPANIMVSHDGRVKVADFGLAKTLQNMNTGLTMSGHVMGTPHFVAPEALTLGMQLDHRADIYAVGVMLYQMLTGNLPQGLFEMPSLKVPGLDPRYDQIVSNAMREDRAVRYQSILDMRRALDAILTQPMQAQAAAAKPAAQRTVVGGATQQKQRAPGQPQRPPQQQAMLPTPRKKSSAGAWVTLLVVLGAVAGGAFWVFQTTATVAGQGDPKGTASANNAAVTPEAVNLLTNASFEAKDTSQWRLNGWRQDKEAGSFEPEAGRNKSTAAVLRSMEVNDISFIQNVKVTPNTDYVVSGWLKTQGVVQEDGKLRGAGLSVGGGFEGTATIGGDNDWTPVQFTFNSKDRTEVEICARLGFFAAAAKGTIWFDDLWMVKAADQPLVRGQPFTNSLGMKFVPVPGTKVLMGIHETRRQDYEAYASQAPQVNPAWRDVKHEGIPSGQGNDHPVVGVNLDDVRGFCLWLSRKEGRIYRLPSEREWNLAAGLRTDFPAEPDRYPGDADFETQFPWGNGWPPVAPVGNYGDAAYLRAFPASKNKLLTSYDDGFATTSPVMSFPPNPRGFYDLGGNVWEFCEGWYDEKQGWRLLKGGSLDWAEERVAKCAERYTTYPGTRSSHYGFRCVLEAPEPKP